MSKFPEENKNSLSDSLDLKAKYLELETILDISNNLNTQVDIKSLLESILSSSASILNSSKGMVIVKNDTNNFYVPLSTFNLDEKLVRSQLYNSNIDFIKNLNKTLKTEIIEIEKDSKVLKVDCEYAIASPLFVQKELVGIIILLDKETRKGIGNFNTNDIKILDAISQQASIAYQNIYLVDSLKKSNKLNDNIMSSITTGVLEINLFGEIEFLNKEAERILGKDNIDVVGNHYHFIFEKNKSLIELIEKVEIGQTRIFETDLKLKFNRKSFSVNLSCSPIFDESNSFSGIVLTLDDQSNINKVKSTFKKYVSKNIVDKLLDNDDSLNLGGEESNIAVLFCDIRGFTKMSEKLEPSEVVNLLNKYFKVMIDVVFKNSGTLDKIIGDELMVLYGVPLKSEDDIDNSVKTAVEMFSVLEKFNEKNKKFGLAALEVGIGINYGKAVSGNIGSDEQMNYTVIGDTVNLAARLCSHAKAGQLVISDFVKNKLSKDFFDFKKKDPIYVKGKSKPINIWSYKHR